MRLLGPVRIETALSGESLGGKKQRSVLALLALRHGEWLSTDAIADELWQTGLPRTWKNSTQRFIADLRHALRDERTVLESATGRYRLSPAPSQLDIIEMTTQLEEGHRFLLAGRFEPAKHELARAAVSVYRRGDF